MTTTQAMIDAGLVALRAWLPGTHDEDARIVVAIYDAMNAARTFLHPVTPEDNHGTD